MFQRSSHELISGLLSVFLLLGSCTRLTPGSPTATAVTGTSVPATTASPTANPPRVLSTQPENNTSSSNGAPVVLLLTSRKGSVGDIYAWNVASHSLKQLTSWGYNFAPHVSPDGKWLAYRSVSQAAVSAITQGQAMNAEPLANIWLFNPYTEEEIQIAEQLENATYVSGNLISRQDPVWSPDGTSVAWVERDTHSERVAIYSLSSKTTITFPLNLPPGCCEGTTPTLYWGRSGIAITNNEGTPTHTEQVIYIFDAQGQQLAKLAPGGNSFLQYGWITDGDNHEYLGCTVNGVFMVFYSLGNAQLATPEGVPEMYGPMAPDELSVYPANNPVLWTITRHGQKVADINDIKDATDISIAPDGQAIVYRQNVEGEYLQGGTLFVYFVNGQTVSIIPQLRVLAVTWGETAWRIHNR